MIEETPSSIQQMGIEIVSAPLSAGATATDALWGAVCGMATIG
jgi:hypothetical protein